MASQQFSFGHPCEHQLRRACIGGESCPLNGFPEIWCCSYVKGKINFKRDKPCEGTRCRWGFTHPTQAQFDMVTQIIAEARPIAIAIDEILEGTKEEFENAASRSSFPTVLSFSISNPHIFETVQCALHIMRFPFDACGNYIGQLFAYATLKSHNTKVFTQLLKTMKKPIDIYLLGAYNFLNNGPLSLKESTQAKGSRKGGSKKDETLDELRSDMIDLMSAALSQNGQLIHRDDQLVLQSTFIRALKQLPNKTKKRNELLENALALFGPNPLTKQILNSVAVSQDGGIASEEGNSDVTLSAVGASSGTVLVESCSTTSQPRPISQDSNTPVNFSSALEKLSQNISHTGTSSSSTETTTCVNENASGDERKNSNEVILSTKNINFDVSDASNVLTNSNLGITASFLASEARVLGNDKASNGSSATSIAESAKKSNSGNEEVSTNISSISISDLRATSDVNVIKVANNSFSQQVNDKQDAEGSNLKVNSSISEVHQSIKINSLSIPSSLKNTTTNISSSSLLLETIASTSKRNNSLYTTKTSKKSSTTSLIISTTGSATPAPEVNPASLTNSRTVSSVTLQKNNRGSGAKGSVRGSSRSGVGGSGSGNDTSLSIRNMPTTRTRGGNRITSAISRYSTCSSGGGVNCTSSKDDERQKSDNVSLGGVGRRGKVGVSSQSGASTHSDASLSGNNLFNSQLGGSGNVLSMPLAVIEMPSVFTTGTPFISSNSLGSLPLSCNNDMNSMISGGMSNIGIHSYQNNRAALRGVSSTLPPVAGVTPNFLVPSPYQPIRTDVPLPDLILIGGLFSLTPQGPSVLGSISRLSDLNATSGLMNNTPNSIQSRSLGSQCSFINPVSIGAQQNIMNPFPIIGLSMTNDGIPPTDITVNLSSGSGKAFNSVSFLSQSSSHLRLNGVRKSVDQTSHTSSPADSPVRPILGNPLKNGLSVPSLPLDTDISSTRWEGSPMPEGSHEPFPLFISLNDQANISVFDGGQR